MHDDQKLAVRTFARHYIRDIVYAANDGIVTTFAVVAGVQGAKLTPWIVLALGFANLIADGLSMAVGNYLGIKSERAVELGDGFAEKAETLHAMKHAGVTWGAFSVAGLIPLLVFFVPVAQSNAFHISAACAAGALFTVGAARTQITARHWFRSGVEMLAVGSLAGAAAFWVGRLIEVNMAQ